MTLSKTEKEFPIFSDEERELRTVQVVSKMMETYSGKDRFITPENVYQPAITAGRQTMEDFTASMMLPGSGIQGLEHLDDCLERLRAGEQILIMADHWGNLDVPAFNALLRREDPKYQEIQEQLVYIAGRKLNESSDMMKMFSELYSRLIIVPRRDYPPILPEETPEQTAAREEYEKSAASINRSAFRNLARLRKSGKIFVLFPLGGRYKEGAENIPVKEATSYMALFDQVYMISMDGNPLPVRERMEDERPVQVKVVYRVSRALSCAKFIEVQKARHAEAVASGEISAEVEYEEYAVQRIMAMLNEVREHGDYQDSY